MEQEILRTRIQIADLLTMVKTQQSTIETLQGRLNTMESDRSKAEKCQDLLEKRVLQLSEQNENQQVLIGRLGLGLEGTKSMTIGHDIPLRGIEKLQRWIQYNLSVLVKCHVQQHRCDSSCRCVLLLANKYGGVLHVQKYDCGGSHKNQLHNFARRYVILNVIQNITIVHSQA